MDTVVKENTVLNENVQVKENLIKTLEQIVKNKSAEVNTEKDAHENERYSSS